MNEAPGAGLSRPMPRGTSSVASLQMASLGAVQGFALWLVHRQWTDSGQTAALTGTIWAIVASGFVLHLARSGAARTRLALLAIAVGAVFGVVAAWVASQLPDPASSVRGDSIRELTWTIASGIALFVLGPFLQIYQASGRLRFLYAGLHQKSWRNVVVVALALGVTATFWLVLLLWGELFRLIGIELFASWFRKSALFAYTATGAAFGYGLAVAGARSGLIDALIGITQSLFRALLSLVAAVSIAFVVSLPLTGLAPLFAASSAATLLIGWLLAALLLFNAVYLDGANRPQLGTWLLKLFEAGVLTMPVLAAIACYAVGLRVAQYGLSPDRFWALVIGVTVSGYSAGYALAVVRRGEPWVPLVRGVNVTMSIVVVAAAFALHTPLMDPLRVSLRDQLARLEDGRTSWDAFDFNALRSSLGQRGYDALDRLAGQAPTEAARARARVALESPADDGPAALTQESFVIVPADRAWPEGLFESLRGATASETWLERCGSRVCFVFAADLDGDGLAEEIVASASEQRMSAWVPAPNSLSWQRVASANVGVLSDAELSAVARGEVETVPARLRDLRIAGRRISFSAH